MSSTMLQRHMPPSTAPACSRTSGLVIPPRSKWAGASMASRWPAACAGDAIAAPAAMRAKDRSPCRTGRSVNVISLPAKESVGGLDQPRPVAVDAPASLQGELDEHLRARQYPHGVDDSVARYLAED